MKLFVCYIPGLDRRRVSAAATPHIAGLLERCPAFPLRTLPSTELLPTLLTGVYPHEHGVWQVRLARAAPRSLRERLTDLLPDTLTTAWQGVRQAFDSTYDLATLPPRRRRRFELHRFKYWRRERSGEVLLRFGSCDSILGLLGDEARYRFTKSFRDLEPLSQELPGGDRALELLELYALDLFQHWNLDRAAAVRRAYRACDAFVRRLDEACAERGVTLLILADHGQERVVGTIPLLRAVHRAGVDEREFSFFVEVSHARFWFHSDDARRRVRAALEALDRVTLLHYRDLARYHIEFPDDAYGELYAVADPGYIFFPHDFYRPLVNLYLGTTDRNQRRRLLRPRHRGNHGYLPEHPSEEGLLLVADKRCRARHELETAELIDFAPTVLALLGRSIPAAMKGTPLFAR